MPGAFHSSPIPSLHWQLKLFFILISFPLLLYGPCWLLRIWPVPLGNLLFWFIPDCLMWASWILTFWSSNSQVPFPEIFLLFISVYFCRSRSKFPTFLPSYDPLLWVLEHAQLHAPFVPIYTDGFKSSEGVGCPAVFPDFDVFISSCSCFNLYSRIMCYIPCPFLYFLPQH